MPGLKKSRNPNSTVSLKDLQTGEENIVALVAALAARHAVPAMYYFRDFASSSKRSVLMWWKSAVNLSFFLSLATSSYTVSLEPARTRGGGSCRLSSPAAARAPLTANQGKRLRRFYRNTKMHEPLRRS
jgi:hypothetical protein